MVKPTLGTKSIGLKVREEEYTRLDAAAQTRAVARGVVPRGFAGERERPGAERPTDSAGTGQVALLAELVALRAILLNVLFRQTNGQTLTAQEMQGLIDRADSDKLKKARERLARVSDPETQPEGK